MPLSFYHVEQPTDRLLTTFTVYPLNRVLLHLRPVPAHSVLRLTSSDPSRVTLLFNTHNANPNGRLAPAGDRFPYRSPSEKTTGIQEDTTRSEYTLVMNGLAGGVPQPPASPIILRAYAAAGDAVADVAELRVDFQPALEWPPVGTDAGILARLLAIEANPGSLSNDKAKDAYRDAIASAQSMRQVIDNRVRAIGLQKVPASFFGARDTTVAGVITADPRHPQFQGFTRYPALPPDRQAILDDILKTANDGNVRDNQSTRDYVNAIIEIAKASSAASTWPDGLYFWNTAGVDKPSDFARLDRTLNQNAFYGFTDDFKKKYKDKYVP